jgi:adenylosuccinate lyase
MLAISPIDGRYADRTSELRDYFSEQALIRYRVKIELEYLNLLINELNLDPEGGNHRGGGHNNKGEDNDDNRRSELSRWDKWYPIMRSENLVRVKEIEKITNHDVKAVEYYLRERPEIDPKFHRWIHFGLTSQDINSSANMLQVKDSWYEVMEPAYTSLIKILTIMVGDYSQIPMLCRTHGQAASPSTLGKELQVYVERLQDGFRMDDMTPWTSKFGGAVGNFNSLVLAFPEVNWRDFGDRFIAKLGLIRSQWTTQIDHYDHLAAHFDNYRRLNVILVDLCQDIWTYISQDYFKLKVIDHEVGSSAMPHKVNPIDFENAEGNLLLANSMFEFFSRKLPISRLQRDLTDSTVLRNVGVALAHTLIALKSISKGLSKLTVNVEKIQHDLQDNWMVIAEGIQIVLRAHGIDDAYERVKEITRGTNYADKNEGLARLREWIESLNVPTNIKEKLINLTPNTYIGYTVD